MSVPENKITSCEHNMIKHVARFILINGVTFLFEIVWTLHEKINGILPGIQFNKEEEENANQLPFLDVLVQRTQDGALKTTVYRKPTHTDQLLQANSNQQWPAPNYFLTESQRIAARPKRSWKKSKRCVASAKPMVTLRGSYSVQYDQDGRLHQLLKPSAGRCYRISTRSPKEQHGSFRDKDLASSY